MLVLYLGCFYIVAYAYCMYYALKGRAKKQDAKSFGYFIANEAYSAWNVPFYCVRFFFCLYIHRCLLYICTLTRVLSPSEALSRTFHAGLRLFFHRNEIPVCVLVWVNFIEMDSFWTFQNGYVRMVFLIILFREISSKSNFKKYHNSVSV